MSKIREFLLKRITPHVPQEANEQQYDRLNNVLAIVAHARNVRLIAENPRKDDRLDAQTLARLALVTFF